MAGYGSRKAPADGKTTELWSKALVLEDANGNHGVLVALDLVGIDRETGGRICTRLREKFGFNRRQIAICTSHTHSGPVVGKNLGPLHYWVLDAAQRKRIETYANQLVDRVEEAVGKAVENLEPSRLQWGSGQATFAVNRRENKAYNRVPQARAKGQLKGPVDHDVPVLSVRNAAGDLRSVLFGYAKGVQKSSSPGEFHPQALTEP